MRNDLGPRLKHVRAHRTQPEMALVMGIAHRTYASYERSERVPDAEALVPLVVEGWNANWLLTGEGPERLESLELAEDRAGYGSQLVSEEHLTLALSQVIEVLQDKELPMPPAKQAELVMAVAELHAEGVPEAKILRFVRAAIAA